MKIKSLIYYTIFSENHNWLNFEMNYALGCLMICPSPSYLEWSLSSVCSKEISRNDLPKKFPVECHFILAWLESQFLYILECSHYIFIELKHHIYFSSTMFWNLTNFHSKWSWSSTSHAKLENWVDINTPLEDEEGFIEYEKVPPCHVRWRNMAW